MSTFQVRAASPKVAEIFIYEDIGDSLWGDGLSSKRFADEMKPFATYENLKVRVNSNGGDVADGMAIYNILRRHPGRKEMYIDGNALSAASIVVMAGDVINMAENAMLMIHDPWTVMMGNAAQLRERADIMDANKDNIVATYARRTKRDPEDIAALMASETWMKPRQALEQGFVDHITDGLNVINAVDPQKYHYRNIPRALAYAAQPKPRLELAKARTSAMRTRAAAALGQVAT